MNLRVTADAGTLLRQAGYTADQYLLDALESIDKRLGDGYAAKHPDLIAAFMHVEAQDFYTAILKAGMDNIADAVSSLSSKDYEVWPE